MSLISNTTVLSNFATIGQLPLLQALYPVLHISTAVYAEIQAGQDEGYAFYAGIETHIYPFSPAGWIHLTGLQEKAELQLLGQLPRSLHSGEASCLAIAGPRGWVFLTDDLAARKQAARLGIRVSGSIGCLALAVERKLCSLPQANAYLAALQEHHYYAPITDLTPLLK